jgi:hypothetical protein
MSTDTTKPANGVEKGTLAVAIATLACSAIGGVVAYVTIDRRAAQLDGRLKQFEIQQAEEQLMELTGGLYDVSTLASEGIFSRYSGPYQMYEPVEVAIVAKNAGTAPLQIKDFELRVFRAPMLAVSKKAIDESVAPAMPVEHAPNGDLELPARAPEAPQASNFEGLRTTPVVWLQEDAEVVAAPADAPQPNEVRVIDLSSEGWAEIKELSISRQPRNDGITRRGQARAANFLVLLPRDTSMLYKFEVTCNPADNEAWSPRTWIGWSHQIQRNGTPPSPMIEPPGHSGGPEPQF